MTLKERDKQAETETHRRTETQRDKNMVLNLLRNYHRDKSIQTHRETLRQGGDSLGSSGRSSKEKDRNTNRNIKS